MAWSKTKTVIVVGIGVLLAAGIATVTVKKFRERQNEEWQLGNMDSKLLLKLSPRTVIIPTKSAERSRQNGSGGMTWLADGRIYGINASIADMLRVACVDNGSVSQDRIVFNVEVPTNKYDFFSNLPIGSKAALQREIQRRFSIVGKFETVETNGFFLRVKNSNATGLKPSVSKYGSTSDGNGAISMKRASPDDLAQALENNFHIPVINQTGLTNNFDFNLKWDEYGKKVGNRYPDYPNLAGLKQTLLDQLGLELVPGHASIEMLVVEKVKN